MSIFTEIYRYGAAALGAQWKFLTPQSIRFHVAFLRPSERRPPAKIYSNCDVELQSVEGFPVYHVQLKNQKPARHIIYLHGGSFVNPMTGTHWDYLFRLMRATPCSVSAPLYGLAPQYNYRDAYRLLLAHYESLLEDLDPSEIVLMGDSAGGGLALGFSQSLASSELPQVGGVVMISPWLDLTLSNPDIAQVQKRDFILAPPGNREAARMWAAGTNLRDSQLSPIYGSLENLPPLCLLIGTDDILCPDASRLRDQAEDAGVTMTYSEHAGMFHVWALLPSPEADRAMEQIVAFLENPTSTHPSMVVDKGAGVVTQILH